MRERTRWWGRAFSGAVLAVVTGCGGGDPTEPKPVPPPPGIRAVAGATLSDTVLSQPVQALVVEVRGPDGALAPNTVVRFGAVPIQTTIPPGVAVSPVSMYVCGLGAPTCGARTGQFGGTDWAVADTVAIDTTDAQGRAKATVRLGTVAGVMRVRITVPEFGMKDSVTYTVTPGQPAAIRFATRDTSITIGAQYPLGAAVSDKYGNARPDPVALSLGAPGTVELTGAAVVAREIGRAWILARAGSAVDSASVRVVPTGRLVVWEAGAQRVRLINWDGTQARTLATGVHSDFGVFPRFDAGRSRVTLHTGGGIFGGPSTTAVVLDTVGEGRRDVSAGVLGNVIATRQLADGTLLLVGRASGDPIAATLALWKVDAAGALTEVVRLPESFSTYAAADIAVDGSRVAYVARVDQFGSARELRALEVASGRVTVLAQNGRSPRWSPTGDRVAFLDAGADPFGLDGSLAVVGVDGTGRRALSSGRFSPGLAWSPDGEYVTGRNSAFDEPTGLRVVRVRDGVALVVPIREAGVGGGAVLDLYQPDWR